MAITWAPIVAQLAQKYRYNLVPASTFGKDLLPRVAAILDVAQISDMIAVFDEGPFRDLFT